MVPVMCLSYKPAVTASCRLYSTQLLPKAWRGYTGRLFEVLIIHYQSYLLSGTRWYSLCRSRRMWGLDFCGPQKICVPYGIAAIRSASSNVMEHVVCAAEGER